MSGITAKPAEVSVDVGVVLLDASPVMAVAVDVPAAAVVVAEVVVRAVEPLIEVVASVSDPGPPIPQPRVAASTTGAAPARNVSINASVEQASADAKPLGPAHDPLRSFFGEPVPVQATCRGMLSR